MKREAPFRIVQEKCIDCGMCREVCPFTAVRIVPTKWDIDFVVVAERCMGCGGPDSAPCVRFCPSPGALEQLGSFSSPTAVGEAR